MTYAVSCRKKGLALKAQEGLYRLQRFQCDVGYRNCRYFVGAKNWNCSDIDASRDTK